MKVNLLELSPVCTSDLWIRLQPPLGSWSSYQDPSPRSLRGQTALGTVVTSFISEWWRSLCCWGTFSTSVPQSNLSVSELWRWFFWPPDLISTLILSAVRAYTDRGCVWIQCNLPQMDSVVLKHLKNDQEKWENSEVQQSKTWMLTTFQVILKNTNRTSIYFVFLNHNTCCADCHLPYTSKAD